MSQQFESFYDRNPSVKAPDRRITDRRATTLGTELDRQRAINAELRELLDRAMGLIGRGMVEGAYKEMVGGEQYANRVWDAAKAALTKAGAS